MSAALVLPVGVATASWYRRPSVVSAPIFRSVVAPFVDDALTCELQTGEEQTEFQTERRENASLPEGRTRIVQEGRNGVSRLTRLVCTRNRETVEDSAFVAEPITPSVNKIIEVGTAVTPDVPVAQMQAWTHDYMLSNGYSEEEFTIVVELIRRESNWSVTEENPSSGAYGLPQAMPTDGMDAFGADWRTNYQTQVKWFFAYCKERYGGVREAWAFWQAHHWY